MWRVKHLVFQMCYYGKIISDSQLHNCYYGNLVTTYWWLMRVLYQQYYNDTAGMGIIILFHTSLCHYTSLYSQHTPHSSAAVAAQHLGASRCLHLEPFAVPLSVYHLHTDALPRERKSLLKTDFSSRQGRKMCSDFWWLEVRSWSVVTMSQPFSSLVLVQVC